MNFETIKNNYIKGLWTAALVKMAVRKGIITYAQFEEITGEPFDTSDEVTGSEFLSMVEEVL